MAVSITKRPYIQPIPGRISRYTCSEQPVYYTFNFTGVDFVAYPAYKLLISVYEFGSNVLIGQRTFRPIASGENNVDIQKFIKPYLESSNYAPDFTSVINVSEPKTMIRFYIKYQEIFDAQTTGSLITDETNFINVVLATKQIGEKYGQNFGEYAGLITPNNELAKFITEFETPVMWRGWPFELSFLFTSEMGGVQLKKDERLRNVNAISISTSSTQMDISQINNINFLKIDSNQDINAKFIDVQIITGSAVTDEYVYQGYVVDGYTEDL